MAIMGPFQEHVFNLTRMVIGVPFLVLVMVFCLFPIFGKMKVIKSNQQLFIAHQSLIKKMQNGFKH